MLNGVRAGFISALCNQSDLCARWLCVLVGSWQKEPFPLRSVHHQRLLALLILISSYPRRYRRHCLLRGSYEENQCIPIFLFNFEHCKNCHCGCLVWKAACNIFSIAMANMKILLSDWTEQVKSFAVGTAADRLTFSHDLSPINL